MAFKKIATFTIKNEYTALNKPEGWEIFNLPKKIKTASAEMFKQEDLHGFDLKTAITENPEHLYVKVFAIKEDEVNDNGDYFPKEELKKSAETFIGVPLFTNHQNDDIEKARGKCVHAWYDSEAGGIYIIGKVDKIAYPKLARGIEQKYTWGCFPPTAPVLMADGTEKNICDIEDGDYVISGKGNVRKVLGKREKGYDYPLLSIKVEGTKQPLVCTSYHNIVSYRLPSICACGCGEELIDLKDKRLTLNNFNRKFKKGHGGRDDKSDHDYIQKIKAKDLKVGDFLLEPKYIDDSCDDYVSEDEAFLIGLFLAEGSYEKRKQARHSVIFNFSHTELDTLAALCKGKLEKSFPNHRNLPTINFYPDASQTRVNVYGKDISNWFYERCGEYSDGKILNEKLMKLGKEKTASILAGFMEGDGYTVKNENYGMAFVSKNLASQFRILLRKIGVRCRYRVRTDMNNWGSQPVHEIRFGLRTVSPTLRDRLVYKKANAPERKCAFWHNMDDYNLRRIKNIEEIEYKGNVYDIEVEEDHTYCVNHIAVSNTSMGTAVDFSTCSVCHKRSANSSEYCTHIKERKGKKFSGDTTCKYHESSDVKDGEKCPVCGSTKGEIKKLSHKEQEIFEYNYGLKFIENSFVVNPACHDCGVTCVLNDVFDEDEVYKKVAEFANSYNSFIKVASGKDIDSFVKIGGVEELSLIKTSMDNLEKVVKSMFKQKQNVSLEYVQGFTKVMADMQELYDELNEQGYAKLPSVVAGLDEEDSVAPQQPMPQPMPQPQVQNTMPETAPGIDQSDMNGMGTITKPKLSQRKIEDFSDKNQKLITKISTINSDISEVIENIKNNYTQNDIGVNMSRETKIAASGDNTEIVTEKQLEKKQESLHPRTDSSPEGITESSEQIGGGRQDKLSNSDSPQVRTDNIPEKITEDQLGTTAEAIVRYDNAPDVITEKQWTEMSRSVASKVSGDYTSVITEAQIRDLLSSHRFVGSYETITEDQLKDIKMTDGLKRWANKNYSLSVMKTATQIIADSIVKFKKSPEEISKVASFISDNTQIKDKVAFLSVLNSVPYKKEERKILASKSAYFSKIASKDSDVSTIDALIVTAADNAQFGITAEDIFDSIAYATRNKNIMAKVDDIVKTKLAEKSGLDVGVNKFDAMDSAIKAMDRPEDGKYRIKATLADVGAPITNKTAFLKGVKKLAQETINDEDVAAVVIKIQVGDNGELILDVEEGGECEVCEQDIEGLIEGPIEDIDVDVDDNEDNNGFDEFEDEEDGEKVAGKKERGKRDGTGPFEDSFRAKNDLKGKRKEKGEKCPVKKAQFDDSGWDYSDDEELGVDFVPSNDNLDDDPSEVFEGGDGGTIKKAKGGFIYTSPEGQNEVFMSLGEIYDKYPNANADMAEIGEGSFAKSKKNVKSASKRSNIVKTAQMMGGEMGGQGGASQAPGAGATLPQVPGDVPPVENFNNEEMGDMDMEGGEEETLEAMPPGSFCGVCKSDDVDIIGGKTKCNNCGATGWIEIEQHWSKYPGITPDENNNDEEEEDEFGGEGFDVSQESQMPEEAPAVAAVVKLVPGNLQKIASQKIKLGSVSPLNGTDNTVDLGNGEHVCLATGIKYKVSYATSANGKNVYAKWEWRPTPTFECDSCKRAKQGFIKALASVDMKELEFDKLGMKEKIEKIDELKKAGALKQIKTASKKGSAIEEYKVAFGGYGEKFPYASCVEKLSRRFGENAVALSGPNEGKPLAKCVCDQLKSADVYSDRIAMKVAGSWSDCSGDEECIEDQIRNGYTIRQAASLCETLKLAVAGSEDLFADELGNEDIDTDIDVIDGGDQESIGTDVEDENMDDIDPFDSDDTTVTIEIPREVAEDIAEQVNGETGEEVVEDVPVDDAPVEDVDIDVEGTPEGEEITETITPEDLDTKPCGDMKPCAACGQAPCNCSPDGTDPNEETKGVDGEGVVFEEEGTPCDKKVKVNVDPNLTASTEFDYKEASNMKSKQGKVGKINSLDIGKIASAMKKEAGEKEIQKVKMQDAVDNYTAGEEGSKMGHEGETIPSAAKPKVPRNNATMGQEDTDLNPNDKPLPKIPSTKETMGHEGEAGLEGGDATFTGGEDGAGQADIDKSASVEDELYHMKGYKNSKQGLSNLAERILQAKKLDAPEAVSKDKDIQPISGKSTIGKEKEIEATEPTKTKGDGNASMIGHENETLGDKPDSPKDHPDVFTGDAQLGEEELNSEKTTKDKGTVIASESDKQESEAYRVAGRMLEHKLITAAELGTKVSELKSYKLAQIKDVEKSIFASKKGLDSVSDGMSQAIVINEASSEKDAKNRNSSELQSKLANLFSLEKRNKMADQDEETQVRRTFNR